jgi:hypothetical protein
MRGASVSLSPPSLYPRSQTIEGAGASHPSIFLSRAAHGATRGVSPRRRPAAGPRG